MIMIMVDIMTQLLSFNFWSLVGWISLVISDLTPHSGFLQMLVRPQEMIKLIAYGSQSELGIMASPCCCHFYVSAVRLSPLLRCIFCSDWCCIDPNILILWSPPLTSLCVIMAEEIIFWHWILCDCNPLKFMTVGGIFIGHPVLC